MRRIAPIFTFLLISAYSFGQTQENSSKNHIPINLSECIKQLDYFLADSTKQKIISYSESEFIGLSHLQLGMYIRNKWGLWREQELSAYFNELGIYHPDNISGVILQSYHRYLSKKPIEFISLLNQARKYENLDPLNTTNEDSLINLKIKFEPFNKVSHQIICELGSRKTDYNVFNKLLSKNNSPTLPSNKFYSEIGYIGNYKKILWSLKGTVYATQKEKSGAYYLEGNNYGFECGLGYALMRKRYIGLITYLDFGLVSFNYTLSNENLFDFENTKNIKEIELSLLSKYVSPGIGLYYNLVPFYNKVIGIRCNYNLGLGESSPRNGLKNIDTQNDITIQGLEVMLSLIIGLD